MWSEKYRAAGTLVAIILQPALLDAASLYVTTNQGLAVVSSVTGDSADSISLGPSDALAVSPNGEFLYVGSEISAGAVTLLRTAGLDVVTAMSLSGRIVDIAVSPDGSRVVILTRGPCDVLAQCDSSALVFDGGLTALIGTVTFDVPFGPRPFDIEVTRDGVGYLLSSDGSVLELNLSTLEVYPVERLPCCFGQMELSPQGDFAIFLGGDQDIGSYVVRSLPGFRRAGGGTFQGRVPWNVFFLPDEPTALLVVRESCGMQVCPSEVIRVEADGGNVQATAPLPSMRALPEGALGALGLTLFLLDRDRVDVVSVMDLRVRGSIDLGVEANRIVAIGDAMEGGAGSGSGCSMQARNEAFDPGVLFVLSAFLGLIVVRVIRVIFR